MLDLFHIAKPQNCDIQTFFGEVGGAVTYRYGKTWNKPRGVSHVYLMLIGGGGDGNGADTGGGSAAVTVWYGAAQNVPDVLYIFARAPNPSGGSIDTTVRAKTGDGAFYTLLTAGSVNGVNAAGATSANVFAASGFYQSTAGVIGSTGSVSASATTFLSNGADTSNVTANYDYTNTATNGNGYFLTSPIIVGVGGTGSGRGGIGCGGGRNGNGGQGMVLIASW